MLNMTIKIVELYLFFPLALQPTFGPRPTSMKLFRFQFTKS
jgi:hypothetical protein